MVKHTYKSYNIYNIKPLIVCLTIYNVIFLCSIFASQGISLRFTERMGGMEYTELSYRSCQQEM